MGAKGGAKPATKKSAKRAGSSSAEVLPIGSDGQPPSTSTSDQSGRPNVDDEGRKLAKSSEGDVPQTPERTLSTTAASGNLVVITNILRDVLNDTRVLARLTWLVLVVAAAIWVVAQADVRLAYLALAMMGGGGTVAAIANAFAKTRIRRREQSEDDA